MSWTDAFAPRIVIRHRGAILFNLHTVFWCQKLFMDDYTQAPALPLRRHRCRDRQVCVLSPGCKQLFWQKGFEYLHVWGIRLSKVDAVFHYRRSIGAAVGSFKCFSRTTDRLCWWRGVMYTRHAWCHCWFRWNAFPVYVCGRRHAKADVISRVMIPEKNVCIRRFRFARDVSHNGWCCVDL